MKPRRNKRTRSKGASLIVTLLCLTVLTIIVVAFLQSMSIERKTAVAYSSITRAQLAAESAQNEAITRLGSLMTALPYHAIGYMNVSYGGGSNQVVTILYGASNASTAPITYYLCSSTNLSTNIFALTNVPNGLTADNSTPVNRRTDDGSTGDPGWMGSPVTTSGALQYRECRAPWVYVLQNPNLPYQPNRSAANYNPYAARYSWWVEDDTSRIDITHAGNNAGSSGAFRPAQMTNIVNATSDFRDAQITEAGQLDLGAIPILNGAPLATNANALNDKLITFRDSTTNLPLDGHILAQATDYTTSEQKARYYTTSASIANDLAGNGRRRANLNAIVTEGISADTIAADLDDIAYCITGKHIFTGIGLANGQDKAFFQDQTDTTNAIMPNFGARFYPGNTSTDHSRTYLLKIAANIRDYIDADNMPTFVNAATNVVAGHFPGSADFPTTSTTPNARHGYKMPLAMGKEAIPYLHKHAYTFYNATSNWTTNNPAPKVTASFYVDQHFGFYNPSTKDFTAPNNTYLRCYQRLVFSRGSLSSFQLGDFYLNLSGLVFPAGQSTVLTTSPGPPTDAPWLGGVGRVYRIPVRQSPGLAPNDLGIRYFKDVVSDSGNFEILDRGGNTHDWYTQMVMGNDDGYYDGFPAITITRTDLYTITRGFLSSTFTSLYGNKGPSRTGDPRSLSEQLQFYDKYNSGTDTSGNHDQTRFYQDSSPDPLNTAKNHYNDPGLDYGTGATVAWPDYHINFNTNPSLADNKDSAYAVIRDEPMTSIGELGNIYDPKREPAPGIGEIVFARGGGRTLRFGQPDDVIGGATATRFQGNWWNGAWRLADIFDVQYDSTNSSMDRTNVKIPAQSRGKLNINSVARDGGVALQAMLRTMNFLPKPYGDNANTRSLSTAELNNLITDIKTYLSTKGPFMDRGELSQVSFFDPNGSRTAGAKTFAQMLDRGREEIVRRIAPMLTTRSSAFTVYAVGQALQQDASGKIIPVSESLKSYTYDFAPKIGDQPTDKVTGYTAKSLYEHF